MKEGRGAMSNALDSSSQYLSRLDVDDHHNEGVL